MASQRLTSRDERQMAAREAAMEAWAREQEEDRLEAWAAAQEAEWRKAEEERLEAFLEALDAAQEAERLRQRDERAEAFGAAQDAWLRRQGIRLSFEGAPFWWLWRHGDRDSARERVCREASRRTVARRPPRARERRDAGARRSSSSSSSGDDSGPGNSEPPLAPACARALSRARGPPRRARRGDRRGGLTRAASRLAAPPDNRQAPHPGRGRERAVRRERTYQRRPKIESEFGLEQYMRHASKFGTALVFETAIGAVPGVGAAEPDLTVSEAVALARHLRDIDPKWDAAKVYARGRHVRPGDWLELRRARALAQPVLDALGVPGPGRPGRCCEWCGGTIAGRSDRRSCSDKCRRALGRAGGGGPFSRPAVPPTRDRRVQVKKAPNVPPTPRSRAKKTARNRGVSNFREVLSPGPRIDGQRKRR